MLLDDIYPVTGTANNSNLHKKSMRDIFSPFNNKEKDKTYLISNNNSIILVH